MNIPFKIKLFFGAFPLKIELICYFNLSPISINVFPNSNIIFCRVNKSILFEYLQ